MMKKFSFINIPLKRKTIKSLKYKSINRSNIFKFKNSKVNDFASFVKSIFEYSMPKIFLENFDTLNSELEKLNWPKKPKIILTSYPYDDDLFKYYCAKNSEIGSKIVITQHGCDNIFDYEDWFINKIFGKKQLSWGDNKKKNLINFLFTKTYKKKKKFNFKKKNKILIISYTFSEVETLIPDGHMSNYEINKKLFHSSKFFLENIKDDLDSKIEIKSLQLSKFEILNNSLKKKFKNKKFIDIKIPYLDIIDKYNLSVHFFFRDALF